MHDSHHELHDTQEEITNPTSPTASCTGSNAPGFPPQRWREQPGARGHRAVRLRPRADRSREGNGRPSPSRRDVSAPVSRSRASACTSPAAA